MKDPHVIVINRQLYVTGFQANNTTHVAMTSNRVEDALPMEFDHAWRVRDFLQFKSRDNHQVLPLRAVLLPKAEQLRDGLDLKEVLAGLRARASAKAARFPQYQGHYDAWVLGRMNSTQDGFKGGSVFHQGQLVLLRHDANPAFVTVYDPELDYDVSVRSTYVDVMLADA